MIFLPEVFEDLLGRVGVVPVLKIEKIDDAVPLAEALVEGGLSVLEITLRTPIALSAIEAIVRALPKTTIGVGTVTRPEEIHAARDAGVGFAVSPGCTEDMIKAADDLEMPFLPGVATASEIIRAQQLGPTVLKLFPVEAIGGVGLLKSLAGPFPGVRFCPTGGVGESNFVDYLALDNVLAVGGSWIAPKAIVAARDWGKIRDIACNVSSLVSG